MLLHNHGEGTGEGSGVWRGTITGSGPDEETGVGSGEVTGSRPVIIYNSVVYVYLLNSFCTLPAHHGMHTSIG